MRIILKRTNRRKSEHGFIFNEKPQVINISKTFPSSVETENGCGTYTCDCKNYKMHLATIPIGKFYDPCQVKTNPCIPNTVLQYERGTLNEIHKCEEC